MKTYKEQFDKLTRAYIEDRVEPFRGCACFVGNLLNGDGSWEHIRCFQWTGSKLYDLPATNWYLEVICNARTCITIESDGTYSPEDIVDLENIFIGTILKETVGVAYADSRSRLYGSGIMKEIEKHPNYENALFHAFENALDLLKQIHESKGEVIEPYTFTQRKLQLETA